MKSHRSPMARGTWGKNPAGNRPNCMRWKGVLSKQCDRRITHSKTPTACFILAERRALLRRVANVRTQIRGGGGRKQRVLPQSAVPTLEALGQSDLHARNWCPNSKLDDRKTRMAVGETHRKSSSVRWTLADNVAFT